MLTFAFIASCIFLPDCCTTCTCITAKIFGAVGFFLETGPVQRTSGNIVTSALYFDSVSGSCCEAISLNRERTFSCVLFVAGSVSVKLIQSEGPFVVS